MHWHLALWQKITGGLFKAARAQNRIVDLQDKEIAILREQNVVLLSKLEVSESQRSTLETKITDLEKEIDVLRPSLEQCNTVQRDFLKTMYQANLALALDYISSVLRIDYEIIANHKDALVEHEMIRWSGRGSGDWGKGLPTYELTAKGRAYLEENKLV